MLTVGCCRNTRTAVGIGDGGEGCKRVAIDGSSLSNRYMLNWIASSDMISIKRALWCPVGSGREQQEANPNLSRC
jgi:hypothetical protein